MDDLNFQRILSRNTTRAAYEVSQGSFQWSIIAAQTTSASQGFSSTLDDNSRTQSTHYCSANVLLNRYRSVCTIPGGKIGKAFPLDSLVVMQYELVYLRSIFDCFVVVLCPRLPLCNTHITNAHHYAIRLLVYGSRLRARAISYTQTFRPAHVVENVTFLPSPAGRIFLLCFDATFPPFSTKRTMEGKQTNPRIAANFTCKSPVCSSWQGCV